MSQRLGLDPLDQSPAQAAPSPTRSDDERCEAAGRRVALDHRNDMARRQSDGARVGLGDEHGADRVGKEPRESLVDSYALRPVAQLPEQRGDLGRIVRESPPELGSSRRARWDQGVADGTAVSLRNKQERVGFGKRLPVERPPPPRTRSASAPDQVRSVQERPPRGAHAATPKGAPDHRAGGQA